MRKATPRIGSFLAVRTPSPFHECQYFVDWDARKKCEKPNQWPYSFCEEHVKICYMKWKKKPKGSAPMVIKGDWEHARAKKDEKAKERARIVKSLTKNS